MGQFSANRQTVYNVFFGDWLNSATLAPDIARLHPSPIELVMISDVLFSNVESALKAAAEHLSQHISPGKQLDEILPFLNVEDRWRAEAETVPKLPLKFRPVHRSKISSGISSFPDAPHTDDILLNGKEVKFGFKTETQVVVTDTESEYHSEWYPSATYYVKAWIFKTELTFVNHAEVAGSPEIAEP